MRGGEWVLDRLARLFGPTDLYTLVHDGRPLTAAIDSCRVITSPLQRLPGAAGRWRRHYLPLYPWAVERLHVARCDLLISTSSAVMKSIAPPPGAPHLCYCHAPARYLWSQTDAYASGAGGWIRGIGLRTVGSRIRRWDRATAGRVTRFLANSAHTAQWIARAWGREAAVVHPPARLDFFTPDPTVAREPWLLVVAALEPYKRTELAIEAANRARLPLKIVGDGTQRKALAARAGPTVQMLGRVDENSLRDLYRRARALLFPQVEDFGLVAVEAQASGCPVVAFAGGGALETVSGRSGVLFHEARVEALLEAIDEMDAAAIDPAECRRSAERFAPPVFDAAIRAHVAELLGQQVPSPLSTTAGLPAESMPPARTSPT